MERAPSHLLLNHVVNINMFSEYKVVTSYRRLMLEYIRLSLTITVCTRYYTIQ